MIAYLIQSYADLPAPPAKWLSAAEQAEAAALRFAKRRQDWLIGRWTAKCLLQATVASGAALETIEIGPARGQAPWAVWPGNAQPCPLSISHCDGRAVAAVDDERLTTVGVDLERSEEWLPGFADDYFTAAELASLSDQPETRTEQVTAIWCAKEAALKALGLGLTVDTRAVSAALGDSGPGRPGWRRLDVALDPARLPRPPDDPARKLSGWLGRREAYWLAIVVNATPTRPSGRPRERAPLGCQERVA